MSHQNKLATKESGFRLNQREKWLLSQIRKKFEKNNRPQEVKNKKVKALGK